MRLVYFLNPDCDSGNCAESNGVSGLWICAIIITFVIPSIVVIENIVIIIISIIIQTRLNDTPKLF